MLNCKIIFIRKRNVLRRFYKKNNMPISNLSEYITIFKPQTKKSFTEVNSSPPQKFPYIKTNRIQNKLKKCNKTLNFIPSKFLQRNNLNLMKLMNENILPSAESYIEKRFQHKKCSDLDLSVPRASSNSFRYHTTQKEKGNFKLTDNNGLQLKISSKKYNTPYSKLIAKKSSNYLKESMLPISYNKNNRTIMSFRKYKEGMNFNKYNEISHKLSVRNVFKNIGKIKECRSAIRKISNLFL